MCLRLMYLRTFDKKRQKNMSIFNFQDAIDTTYNYKIYIGFSNE